MKFLKLPGAAQLAGEGTGSWATPTTRDHKDGDCTAQLLTGGVKVNALLGRQALLATGGLAHAECERRCGRESGGEDAADARQPSEARAVNGFWRDAEWIPCRDGKARPVEPGTFPLAHGAAARVGRLRAYGNAVNAEAARCFIEAYLFERMMS